MIQEYIYTQDINRTINGVIKASSTADLANEVKEYVITAEQQKKSLLPALFKMLVPPAVPTCVWISGDFGSGRSHLLKILPNPAVSRPKQYCSTYRRNSTVCQRTALILC